MSKKNEKEELWRKTFGSDAPKRTLSQSDLELLSVDPFSGVDMTDELETLQKNSEKLKKQTEEILKITDFGSDLDTLKQSLKQNNNLNADLDSLKQSLKNDFGSEFPLESESSLSIVSSQSKLNEIFAGITDKLNQVVLQQSDYIDSLAKAFKRPLIMGQQPSGINAAILITGSKDTGRHTSINEITKLLVNEQILGSDVVSVIDLAKYTSKDDENNFFIDLYGANNNSQVIIFDNIDAISPSYLNYVEEILTEGKLTLNKRYVLNNKQLVETTNSLAKNTIKELSFKGKFLAYITSLKTSKLLNVVGSRFINSLTDTIRTDDIDADEILAIYPVKFAQVQTKCLTNLNVNLVSENSINAYLSENYTRENMAYLNKLLDDLYSGVSEYKLNNPSDDKIEVSFTSIDNQLYLNDAKLTDLLPAVVDVAVDDVKAELDQLVGLTEVKDYIYGLQDFYAAQKKRQMMGLKTTEVSKHMIFTGNPGTGKTTIARLLAKYLKAIGVLSNGQLVEVTRNDLVGKYVGHTAPLTMQVIKSAIGGILFIDEAYSLYRGNQDSFGLECIDTLVKAMEDNRDNLIVILAGYTKEMSVFLEANSGLQSRFPNQIEFPDYTGEELYEIAKINAKSAGYKIDEAAKDTLVEYFNKVQQNDSVRSGNGRLSRNEVEEAIINQSKRVIKDENAQIDLLTIEDFNLEN